MFCIQLSLLDSKKTVKYIYQPHVLCLRRLEGQLSVLPNFTNSAKIFHIIKDFNLNVKTIFKSTSFQNLLQLRVLHIKSTLKLEKNKFNNCGNLPVSTWYRGYQNVNTLNIYLENNEF